MSYVWSVDGVRASTASALACDLERTLSPQRSSACSSDRGLAAMQRRNVLSDAELLSRRVDGKREPNLIPLGLAACETLASGGEHRFFASYAPIGCLETR